MITYIVDMKDQLRDLVYSRFRKTRVLAYIEALGDVFQMVESDVYGTSYSMLIAQATGETLNRWGALVGEQRQGLTDEQYRAVIRSKIKAAKAGGTARYLMDSLAAITGDENVEFRTSASGWSRLAYTGSLAPAHIERMLRILNKGIAAGFGLEVIQMSTDPFRFGDTFGRTFGSERIDS